MIGALIGALALVVFVTAHEAGHFFAAKATGMKATEFFFGFGPKLFSTTRGETEYGVKALPLGGYVRIVGMNPFEEVAPEDRGRTYREKPFWKKSVVVLAGVGMNFLIAYLMFAGLILAEGIPAISTTVDAVVAEADGEPTPAAASGLQVDDRIVAVDGRQTPDWESLQAELSQRPGEDVVLTVDRNGSLVDVPVTMSSRTNPETGETEGFLGIRPGTTTRSAGVLEAGVIAGQQTWATVGLTFEVMGNLIQPESLGRLAGVFVGNTDVPDEIRPVSPIGMANIGSQADAIGVGNYIGLLASINVILATFNVLPLLPLDGGHFAVALWQKVTGKEPDIRKLMPVAVAVIVLFTFLGLAAMILDIVDPIQLS